MGPTVAGEQRCTRSQIASDLICKKQTLPVIFRGCPRRCRYGFQDLGIASPGVLENGSPAQDK